ncbi:hypothetical protein LTR17_006948 [Elasticomyces elasticus]|nr:hypothetical protein LTR17_006948 [Elasticomyces elasticus]
MSPSDELRTQAVRGLFHILQHYSGSLDTREAQAAAIHDHLQTATYYRSFAERPHDVRSFRNLAAEVAGEARLTAQFGKDKADALFSRRLKGIRSAQFIHYGYDRESHCEADLPPFGETVAVSEVPRAKTLQHTHTQRAVYIVLCDIDAVRPHCESEDYKYGSRPRALQAIRHLIEQYQLQRCAPEGKKRQLFTNEKVFTAVHRAMTGHDSATGERLARHRRLRNGLHSTWSIGTDRIRQKYLTLLRESTKHREMEDSSLLYDERAAIPLYSNLCTELRRQGFVIPVPRPRYRHTQPAPRMTAVQMKRLIDEDVTDTDEESQSDATNPANPASSGQMELRVSAATSARTQLPGCRPDATADFDRSSEASTLSERGLSPTLSSRESQIFERVDLDAVSKEVSGLIRSMRRAVDQLFGGLNMFEASSSPVIWSATGDLISLYEGCWGPQWSVLCLPLNLDRHLLAKDAMMSLVARFTYDNIFECGPAWQVFEDMMRLGASRTQGGPLAALVARFTMSIALPCTADYTTQQRLAQSLYDAALSGLASDGIDNVVDRLSSQLAVKLCGALDEHIASLSALVESLSGHSKQGSWHHIFRTSMCQVMKQAIMLKVKLLNGSMSDKSQYTFTWYSHGVPLEPVSMEPKFPPHPEVDYKVAFTLFPGLETQHVGGAIDHTSRAQVIVQAA